MFKTAFVVLFVLMHSILMAADSRVVAESERSFSRLAGEKGIRASFLQYMAPDSVVFRGGPVNGQQWYQNHAEIPGNLYWMPALAAISAAGDLGYTSGPWEYRNKATDEKPLAVGTFNSIWKKQADGAWKVVVDIGTEAPALSVSVRSLENVDLEQRAAGVTAGKLNEDSEKAALLESDRQYSAASAKEGLAAARGAWAEPASRFVHEGMEPADGSEAIRTLLQKITGKITWEPAGAGVAASGDLGYTYGTFAREGDPAPVKGNYLHVWNRQPGNKWRVVLDVLSIEQK